MRSLRDTHRATSVGLAPHISALQAHRTINIFYYTHIYDSNHNDSLTIGSNTWPYFIGYPGVFSDVYAKSTPTPNSVTLQAGPHIHSQSSSTI